MVYIVDVTRDGCSPWLVVQESGILDAAYAH